MFTALVAAIFSSLVSQPGDTLVTKVTKAKRSKDALDQSSNVVEALRDILAKDGVSGLFVGTQARLLHVSFFVTVQLLVYDMVKQLCGIPPTGSH